jgi:hypothetical protein
MISQKETAMFIKRLPNIVMIALPVSLVILFPDATSTRAARGGPNKMASPHISISGEAFTVSERYLRKKRFQDENDNQI